MADDLRDDTGPQITTGSAFKKTKSDTINETKEILRGKEMPAAEAVLQLVKTLKQVNAFTLARRLLALARAHPASGAKPAIVLKLAQQHALATYKDPELPADARLNRALSILSEVEDLSATRNQETLGLAGAIYKRKWEVDGQRQHLETSLNYYLHGYEEGGVSDDGYTGINAAFLLDLLASQEETITAQLAGTQTAAARREMARNIRGTIRDELSARLREDEQGEASKNYWLLVTIAEAHFGLLEYAEAVPYLKAASEIKGMPPWCLEATAQQLARLALLSQKTNWASQEFESSEAGRALHHLLRGNLAAVRTAFLGKAGLALSGGGFRASLFHIGVLAKLAELDMLRHVEVLSCVSGGSIIGAHYYLEVRRLLAEKADGDITREDYIEMVKRIEVDFLAGVQRNVRTRVLGDPIANLKMMFRRNYSRTLRVGELYESEIYSRIKDGEGGQERWLDKVFVCPKGEPEDFSPAYDNWRRHAKAPILILNATALNTGHNWQFTASFMGEPPANSDNEVDGNYRLRRMYYGQAPEDYQKMRLGYAVAASSCVPGLFEPLAFDGLYPDKTVRLVDGGVHDNQGVAGLLDQDCTVLLVSDASGQMTTIDDPSAGLLGVPLRSNSILMSRVRESEYEDLSARKRSSLLRGLMFIHLKKDLQAPPVDWVDCEDPFDNFAQEEFYDDLADTNNTQLTRYGVMKRVQYRLSAIRTDLDSFSDTEAFALMTSGYRMTEFEFPRGVKGFSTAQPATEDWRFLSIEAPMRAVTGHKREHEKLMQLLKVGEKIPFKIWAISKALRYLSVLLAVVALAAVVYVIWKYRQVSLLTVGHIGMAVAVMVATAILGKTVLRVVRLRETLTRIVVGFFMAVFGWLAAWTHLLIFDRWFLRAGHVPVKEAAKKKAAGAS